MFTLQLLLSACAAQVNQEPGTFAGVSSPGANSILPGEPALSTVSNPMPVKPRTMAAFERANDAIASEQWSQAAAELHALVDNRPDLSGPCLNLALVYRQLDKPQQAEPLYRQALRINPGNMAAYNELAIFLREMGRFAEAEQTYLQALSVWEEYPQTHRNIGVLYDLYLGDRQRALQHFTRYQALTGDDDGLVAGWIVDLQRQLPALAQGGQAR
jgi:Flp pilus assembly protein TadD